MYSYSFIWILYFILFHVLAPLYEILYSSLGAWYEKYEMFLDNNRFL